MEPKECEVCKKTRNDVDLYLSHRNGEVIRHGNWCWHCYKAAVVVECMYCSGIHIAEDIKAAQDLRLRRWVCTQCERIAKLVESRFDELAKELIAHFIEVLADLGTLKE